MDDIMGNIIAAVVGGSFTALIIFIANMVRTSTSVPRRVQRLEEISMVTLDSLHAIREGTVAIAEAVSGKRCNGNVDNALEIMTKNRDDTVRFLNASVAGGHK